MRDKLFGRLDEWTQDHGWYWPSRLVWFLWLWRSDARDFYGIPAHIEPRPSLFTAREAWELSGTICGGMR